jgi:hypothetical protein
MVMYSIYEVSILRLLKLRIEILELFEKVFSLMAYRLFGDN